MICFNTPIYWKNTLYSTEIMHTTQKRSEDNKIQTIFL